MSQKVLRRYMVRVDEQLADGRSLGIYEREVWAATKREAREIAARWRGGVRPRVLGLRQVGGKKVEDEP